MTTSFLTPPALRGTMGTLISGTLRPEDLIPAFLSECDRLNVAVTTPVRLAAELHELGEDGQASETVDELMDCLNLAAPFGCYFGANEGDGSDFGFWCSNEISCDQQEAYLLWCDYLGETVEPSDFEEAYCGEYRHGSDFAYQLADDIGVIPEDAGWPSSCIDWEQAWRELEMGGDYTALRGEVNLHFFRCH